jgi:DNA polymerase III subunit delta
VKLPAARVSAFLQRPDRDIRAVLLYGPDAGLIRDRSDTLARAICPDLRDPFRVTDLTGLALAADPARLADEAAQMSLAGGRRVVRVRDATDRLSGLFSGFLDTAPGDGFIVVEAGDLPGSSPLRRVFDGSPRAATIGCYPDAPRDRAAVISDTLRAHRVAASSDAIQYLVEHLGNDRLLTRAELEKLTLYAGDGGRIELDDARLSVGDSASLALDDAVMAAAEGDAARVDRVLDRVFQEGESPVSVVRATLRHLQRLHALAARFAAGAAVAELVRTARPPIFYKQQDNFKRQLAMWSEAGLRAQLDRVAQAELQMKLTGLPAQTICREAMLAVAETARTRATQQRRIRGQFVPRP